MKHTESMIHLAADIISASDRDHPADRVLREYLRELPQQESALRRDVSEAVFAWYKWSCWLGLNKVDPSGIGRAVETHRQFQRNAESFDAQLLREHVVPSWCEKHVEFDDPWILALQRDPQIWLRARPGRRAELVSELGVTRTGELADSFHEAIGYDGDQDLFRTEAFHKGRFEIQDLSSQIVGLICDPKAGETWWDVCAGEGGKTLHLSDLMDNKGMIWATDPAEWRLKKMKRRAARAGVFNYRGVVWHDKSKLPTKNRFDGVLVDAPCSGLGTWQRNPHARWTTSPQDIAELSILQTGLLTLCAQSLKPGGRLIYSVCTMTGEETHGVADALDATAVGLQPLEFTNPLEPGSSPTSRLMIWPQQKGGNGMFIAAWKRPD